MSQRDTAQTKTVPLRLTVDLQVPQALEEPPSQLDETTCHSLVLRYRTVVRDRLEERAMVVDHSTSTAVHALAGELGVQAATPRDVVDVHVLAVRDWAESTSTQRARAILSAAESVLIETLGQLATYYRAAALGNGRDWQHETTA